MQHIFRADSAHEGQSSAGRTTTTWRLEAKKTWLLFPALILIFGTSVGCQEPLRGFEGSEVLSASTRAGKGAKRYFAPPSSARVDADAIRTHLDTALQNATDSELDDDLIRFYKQRGFSPAFLQEGQVTPEARALAKRLRDCQGWADPLTKALTRFENALDDAEASRLNSTELVDLEVDLTAAYLTCAVLGAARSANSDPAEFNWDSPEKAPDFVAMLSKGLAPEPAAADPETTDKTAAEDAPSVEDPAKAEAERQAAFEEALSWLVAPHPQVAHFHKAIERYRGIVDAGGWPQLPEGETMEVGEPADWDRLQLLAQRLQMEGYLPKSYSPTPNQPKPVAETKPAPTEEAAMSQEAAPAPAPKPTTGVYDETIAAALGSFQQTHGLTVDEKLGPNTLRTLNVPAKRRLAQLELNQERSYWLPYVPEGKFTLVNVPGFRLHVMEDGRPKTAMNIVVGKNTWQTPTFADKMEYLVVNPAWNIPRSIAQDEILPKQRQDPGYLDRQNIQVVEGAGDSTRLRQAPGPKNPLGRIKFIFPNRHNVYLHDTPARAAFEDARRARSHGCVRVEDPIELARALLSPEDFAEVQSSLRTSETETVSLPEKLPVYLVYMTAWVNEEGIPEFYPDIYDRDAELHEVMKSQASIEKGGEALMPLITDSPYLDKRPSRMRRVMAKVFGGES